MSEFPAVPPSGFTPRNGTLIATGVLFGLFGLMLCGFGVLATLQYFLMGQMSGMDPELKSELESMKGMMGITSLVNLIVYGGVGILMIVVSFGCFLFKRWARPLVLTISWGWLYMGVVMMISIVMMMGPMKQFMAETMSAELAAAPAGSAPTPASMDGFFTVFLLIYLVFLFVFLVLVPGLLLKLNWGSDVRRTLELRDPHPRWTDRQAAPLIGLTIATFTFAVVSIPSLLMMNQSWMSQFFPNGMLRNLFFLVPLGWAYVAWGSYRGRFAAWVLALLLLIGGAAIGVFSMQNVNWTELYQQMGMPEKQVAQMAPLVEQILSPKRMVLLMGVSMLPMLGYLIWVLRYFRKQGA